jgi:lipopolysaccharide biosynthesis protein
MHSKSLWGGLMPAKRLVAFNYSPTSNRICLFAHFNTQGQIDPVVVHYLEAIKKEGLDIVIITTSPNLLEEAVESVREVCHAIIHRENTDFDFGSWKCGLNTLELTTYDELLLANDSVFGPIYSLNKLFERVDSSKAALIGLTDSWEFQYHLQSYFLYFKKEVFKSEAFANFWKQDTLFTNKWDIITRFELTLTNYFRNEGYTAEPLYAYSELKQKFIESGYPYTGDNPSIDMWEVLLRDFDYPFLKRELLIVNPRNNIKSCWQSYFKDNEVLEKIKDYLKKRS